MIHPPESLPGARLLFSLDSAVGHLNHGSTGAVPITVQRAQQRFRDEVFANPHRFYSRGLADRVAHVRRFLATSVGADPDGTALVTNATEGITIALRSVAPSAGSEIITTDHGYGAVDLAVNRACRDTGAAHRTVPVPLRASDDEIVALISAAVHPDRTSLVIVDQITSPTARLFPVKRIISAVRARAPQAAILVDGAHVPGNLAEPVGDLGADFWVGNLHKWAFAPPGTALMAVAGAWRSRVAPPVLSWQLEAGFPDSVEYRGTVDYSPWLAAPTGMYVLRALGLEAVRAHNAELAAWGQAVVGTELRIDPASLPGGTGLPMRLIPLPPGIAANTDDAVRLRESIADRLLTEVAVGAWRGQGLLRISAQIYNRPDEYERLADGLPKLLTDLTG